MSAFSRPLPGYRFADILVNDTLQVIAARELGEAARWAELITLNDLIHPYITPDANAAHARLRTWGDTILVPAPQPVADAEAQPELVFGADISLGPVTDGAVGGQLSVVNGDLALISGRANLRQALRCVIVTDQGEILFHPEYGCRVRRLLGRVTGPTANLLAAEYVKGALLSDERVKTVLSSVAAIQGDVIRVTAEIQPVLGSRLSVSEQL